VRLLIGSLGSFTISAEFDVPVAGEGLPRIGQRPVSGDESAITARA
jgi:hypothetical protein